MNAIFFASMLLMALLALSFVAAPLIRNAWASSPGFTNVPLLIVLATLLLAFGLYAAIGRPDVATGELANNSLDMVAQKRPAINSDAKAASVSKLLAGLEQRLQEDPGNAKDWLLLAKSYDHLGQRQQAADAYTRAESLGLSDSALATRINGKADPTNNHSPVIRGRISVSPEVANDVSDDDVIYIIAKSTDGNPMPLAVMKRPAEELPLEFELSDDSSMVSGRRILSADTVIVTAKLSRSGDALNTGTELQAISDRITPGDGELVELLIR